MFRQKALYPARQPLCDFVASYGNTTYNAAHSELSFPTTSAPGDLCLVAAGNTDALDVTAPPGFAQIYQRNPYSSYKQALFWKHLGQADPGANMGSWTNARFYAYAIYRPNFEVASVEHTVVYQYGGTGNPAAATVDMSTLYPGELRAAFLQITSNYGSSVAQTGVVPDFTVNVNWNPYEGVFAMKLYMPWEAGGATTWDQADTTGARSNTTGALKFTLR